MSRQRLKVLLLNTKKSIPEITAVVRRNSYEGNDFGYHAVYVSDDDSLHATYSEKVEFNDETYDPFGNVVEEISYVSYRNIEFHIETLDTNKLLMVIYNPPKSTRSFFNNFAQLLDFGVGYSSPELNLVAFKSSLETNLRSKLEGTGRIKVSRLIIDKTAKATVELVSNKDAFESINKLVGEKEYKLDKLSSSISYEGHTIDFEISKSCSIRVRDEYIKYLLPSLKDTLKHN